MAVIVVSWSSKRSDPRHRRRHPAPDQRPIPTRCRQDRDPGFDPVQARIFAVADVIDVPTSDRRCTQPPPIRANVHCKSGSTASPGAISGSERRRGRRRRANTAVMVSSQNPTTPTWLSRLAAIGCGDRGCGPIVTSANRSKARARRQRRLPVLLPNSPNAP